MAGCVANTQGALVSSEPGHLRLREVVGRFVGKLLVGSR